MNKYKILIVSLILLIWGSVGLSARILAPTRIINTTGTIDWQLFNEIRTTTLTYVLGGQTNGEKSIFFQADYGANRDNYRVRSVGGTASFRFNFIVPDDFVSIVDCIIVGSVRSGANTSGRDIDLFSSYGKVGEANTHHAESDTSSVYDLTAAAEDFISYSLISILTNLSESDHVGVFVDHNSIGGTVDYLGIRLIYR